MSVLSSRLIVSLIDRASGPARQIASSLGLMQRAGRTTVFGTQMMGEMRRFKKASNITSGSLSIATGLMARYGAQAVYNFEKLMNKIQATGSLSDDQRASLEGYIKELNKDFPFVNAEIAKAALELYRAGLNFDQAKGALRDTLLLSLAGDIDLGEASDIATNVLTAMRLPMEGTEQVAASLRRVVDNLAYAANNSNTDVRMMGETMKYVAPMAAAAGMDIEQVAAMSMIMASNGIKASEAGVAMRSALVRLVKPTKTMLGVLDRYNINLNDFLKGSRAVSSSDVISGLAASGIDASSIKGRLDAILSDTALQQKPAQMIARLTSEISDALGSDSVIDKDTLATALTETITASATKVDLAGFMRVLREKGVGIEEIAKIFDARQGARLITLLTGDIDKVTEKVISNSAGTADRMGKVMMKSIIGPTARLKASWENLWLTLAKRTNIIDDIANAFDRIAGALDRLGQANPKLLKLAIYAAATIAVMGPLGILLGGVASSFTMLASAARMAGIAMLFFSRGTFGLLGAPLKGAMRGLKGMRREMILLNGIASTGLFSRGALAGMGLKRLGVGLLALLNPLNLVRGGFVAIRFAVAGLVALLGAISWPVVLGVAAIATVIAAWDELKAFFDGFFTGIDQAFSKAGLGKPIEAISNALGTMIGYVKDALSWLGKLVDIGIDEDQDRMGRWFDRGKAAADGLASAVKSVIEGMVYLRDLLTAGIFSDGEVVLKRIGPKPPAIDGQRALGGSVRQGGTYLVGERGPELFRASSSGIIVPNHKLGSQVDLSQYSGSASSSSFSGGRSSSVNVGGIHVHVAIPPHVQTPKDIGDILGREVMAAVSEYLSDGGL